jgi:hypothetical protein
VRIDGWMLGFQRWKVALVASAVLATTLGAPSRAGAERATEHIEQSTAVDRWQGSAPLVATQLAQNAPASDATRGRVDVAELDRKLVDFNGQLAVYTLCLALIAALQFAALVVQAYFLWKTLRLARVSADVARASAEVLPALERAYVFVKPRISMPLAIGWHAGSDLAARTVSIKYSFTNHGKTPAVVRGIDARFDLSMDTPDNAEQPYKPLDNEPVVDPNRSTDPDEVFIDRVISGDEVKALKEGRAFLWFYGSILYEDISKQPHVTRFRWRYEGMQQHFGPAGGAPYNDRT